MGYLGNKPISANTYSKDEIDSKVSSLSLDGSPLDNRYYTEPEVDGKDNLKANSNDVYTKQEVDNNISTAAETILNNTVSLAKVQAVALYF